MKNARIFPLLLIMLFDHTSLNITFPVLTLIFFDSHSLLFSPATSDATRSLLYGACIALPHIVNIVMTPFLSALSDEYGRRKILIFGTFGAVLFAVTAGFGVMWGMLSLLFLGHIIRGAFSRTNPIAQAVIGDISDKKNKLRNMGYLQFAISVGAFIGPVIGGYFANQFFFAQLNYSLPYFIAAIFALISCLLTFFIFQETLITPFTPQKVFATLKFSVIKKVIFNSNVMQISIVLLLSQISWSLYYQFIPPVLKNILHFDAHQLGLFIGIIAFWLAIATSVGIRVFEKFLSLQQLLFVSLSLVLLGLLLTLTFCYFRNNVWHTYFIWLAAIPTAVGDVVAYSCITAFYSDAVDKHEQGKVMGVCFVIVALIWALTGMLGGMLMSINILLPLLLAPIGIILALVYLKLQL